MNFNRLNEILDNHRLWLQDNSKGKRADLVGANLRGANLYGANLRGADLERCKGILSFCFEQHFGFYFKHDDIYYLKIGCITKTLLEWKEEYNEIGLSHNYNEETIKLYGDMINLCSQYEIL